MIRDFFLGELYLCNENKQDKIHDQGIVPFKDVNVFD